MERSALKRRTMIEFLEPRGPCNSVEPTVTILLSAATSIAIMSSRLGKEFVRPAMAVCVCWPEAFNLKIRLTFGPKKRKVIAPQVMLPPSGSGRISAA